MKLGYVGLGALGSELARRFLGAHDVVVWDLNAKAVQKLVDEGARAATSAADLAQRCDVVLTCLPRSADVQRLLFGPAGLADALRPGSLLIDQTSGTPAETRAMAQTLAARGVAMIDAPVSASPQVVPQGAAVLMVAGPDEAVERARAVLLAIGNTIYRCGTRVGDAQAMKMLNNAMNSGVRLGTLEIAALGRKAGLTLAFLTQVLNTGAAANLTTERMLPNIAVGKESTNFALALMVKDLNQAADLGLSTRSAMPVTGVVRAMLQIGLNLLGESARLEQMIGIVESMAGTRLRHDGDPASRAMADPVTRLPVVTDGQAEDIARALHAGASAVNLAITLECVAVGRRYGLSVLDMAQVLVRTSGWSGAGRELLPALAADTPRATDVPPALLDGLRQTLRLGQRHGAPLLLASAACAVLETGA